MAVSVDAKNFMQIIKRAKNVLDFKDGRWVAQALRFEFGANYICIIACDYRRIGVFEIPYTGKRLPDFVIDYKVMDFSESAKIVIDYDADEKIVSFAGAIKTYRVPALPKDYPNWQSQLDIHKEPVVTVSFNRPLLIKTLQSMTDERVNLNIYGDTQPLILTDEYGGDKRLQLPMRKL